MKTAKRIMSFTVSHIRQIGVFLIVCAIIASAGAGLLPREEPGMFKKGQPWFLSGNNPLLNQGEWFYTDVPEPETAKISDFTDVPEVSLNNIKDLVEKLTAGTDAPADIEAYKIHSDGGLIFNPIYQEAVKTGILKKYTKAHLTKGTLKLGDTTLTYEVPKNATAYDTVPIKYTLTTKSDAWQPIHVEANAWEDPARAKNGQHYSMNLPDKVALRFDYLGYVAGNYDDSLRPHIDVNESSMAAAYRIARAKTAAAGGAGQYAFGPGMLLEKNIRLMSGSISGEHMLYVRNLNGGALAVNAIRLIRADGTYSELPCGDTWSVHTGSAAISGGVVTGLANGGIIKITGVDFGNNAYTKIAVQTDSQTADKTLDIYLDSLPGSFAEETPGTAYPNAHLGEFTASTELPVANDAWFRVRYTNTGNTVIDPDGNGYVQFRPTVQRMNPDNEQWYEVATSPNVFFSIPDALYPGESRDTWFQFANNNYLQPGQYRISIQCLANKVGQSSANGYSMIRDLAWQNPANIPQNSYFTFTVKADPQTVAPENPAFSNEDVRESLIRNDWVHTFEEFMSSYDSWLAPVENKTYEGYLYLQVASWTKVVTLRLINEAGNSVACVRLPLNVDTESIKLNFNPDNNNYIINSEGKREPMRITQNMTDLRSNISLGPDADRIIANQLLDMRECGINTLTSVNGFMYDNYSADTVGALNWNKATDAYKFSTDLTRLLGIKNIGLMSYPYSHNSTQISTTLGEPVVAQEDIGFSDPLQHLKNAVRGITLFHRWGDTYYKDADGNIPYYLEDTRGYNWFLENRFEIGELGRTEFQKFLAKAYGDVATLNKAWGSTYTAFAQINPEDEAQKDVFVNYSKPMRVFDIFRTVERVESYNKILQMVSENVPNPKIMLSQENDGWIVQGISPQSVNARYRYQLRATQTFGALIPEIMAAAGVVSAHSDYHSGNGYRPSEVYELASREVAMGISPMWTARFGHVHDFGENPEYGHDVTKKYNSKSTLKSVSMIYMQSVFLWWAAIYEAGGTPGILWNDYATDGVVSSTQKREMEFFNVKMKEALNTPEGKKWAALGGNGDTGTDGKWSYDESYVRAVLREAADSRVPGQLPS